MGKQFIMAVFFQTLHGRVQSFAAASITIIRQGLWLMLFLLGWASTAQADIPASERAVLVNIYNSTNGAGWTNNIGWNGAAGTECTSWLGIRCNATGSHVISVYLGSNNLVGTLPSLSGLTALQEFDVSYNKLTGAIPPLGGLKGLESFWVGHNQLTGAIPPLSGLSFLVRFYADDNQLTGSIPSLIGLDRLGYFYVENNQLTGPVPDPSALQYWPQYNSASLCGNNLTSSGNQAIDAAWTKATGVDWLACQTAAGIPASERAVLIALYNSTNGAGWTSKTNWNGAAETECTWYGVGCDAAKSHVTSIDLSKNNLVGDLPALGGLTALQIFWVSNNQLTGAIPSLNGLTALGGFDVSANKLTGAIPALSGLTALSAFSVGNNQLTGSIPSLSGLTALLGFSAYDNRLTGTIPPLSWLTALQAFAVSNNLLTGPVPAPPASLVPSSSELCGNSLTTSGNSAIDAAWTKATGTDWLSCQTAAVIPASERAVLLDLYSSTSIPGWINNTNWNGAAGTECTWYGVWCNAAKSHVTSITLSSNNLFGTLPSLGGLTALQYFDARDNLLMGDIPSLSGLTALQKFYVGINQLTGSIPSLGGLTALQSIDVSKNQLTGTIPSLSGLTALQSFWVDDNQLTGPVPAAPASLVAYESLLCGNSLTSSGNPTIDAAWTTATGKDWLNCQGSDVLLTVTKSGTGSGVVTSSPAGVNCGALCRGTWNFNRNVTLTATPATGSYFTGWSGDCTGAGSCAVTMSAAKNVTATFKPVPFVATTISTITPTSATITTTITINAPDVDKHGSVFVTAWAPVNGLSTFGISSAGLSKALSVTATSDNPYLAGKVDSRQETLGTLLAATNPNTWVLVQKTPSGWKLVVNGQLIPFATGVLRDFSGAQSILNNTDPTNLSGTQFCVGYGTSDTEMIRSGRMLPVAIIPDANGNAATNGSCNVTDVVVEFYNTNLDNYFVTADASEAAAIDNGSAGPGWSRTGNSFRSGGSTSVCRFYGSYSPGPNSHFYTVDPAECQGLKDQQIPAGDPLKLTVKSWNFESLDFVSTPATNQTCPTGATPVYRAYNNGFARGVDSNHRITSSLTAIQEVVTRGWSNEGVVMCAPN